MNSKDSILEMEGVVKRFGGVTAVDNISFGVKNNSITGLIGPNGAGKTVMLNLITGIESLDSGKILYKDNRIDNLDTPSIIEKGIRRTFQIIRVFNNMTLEENIRIGMQGKRLTDVVTPSRVKESETEIREILDLVDLWELRHEKAKSISFGQKKLLEFAMTFSGSPEPDSILLDEPFSGINPTLTKRLVNSIKEKKKEGKTFLIIDHEVKTVMDISDKVICMHLGKKIAEGKPKEVTNKEKVIDAYLGV